MGKQQKAKDAVALIRLPAEAMSLLTCKDRQRPTIGAQVWESPLPCPASYLASDLAACTIHSAKVARAERGFQHIALRQGHPILHQARTPP